MDSSSKHGPRTRSQSSRPPSPPQEGTAPTPKVDTPSHRTDKPWTEVVTGASTPRAAALAPPPPDHPYESPNQFTSLRQTDDDGSDDSSRRSTELLLTPGDLGLPHDEVGAPPGTVGDVHEAVSVPWHDVVGAPPGTVEDVHEEVSVPGNANPAPTISYSDLNAIVQATAIGLHSFQKVMEESLTALTNTVQATSSQIASISTALAETKETADRAFRQASAANVALAGQGARLDALADAVSTVDCDLRVIRPPTAPPQDLPALIQAALDPLKVSLSTAMNETVALATATAEAAIRTSFDQSTAALNERVTVSLEAFDKRIDALHGSTYGHLKKTELPNLARRIDALEARGVGPPPPDTDKPDPDDDEAIGIVGDDPRTNVRVVADDARGAAPAVDDDANVTVQTAGDVAQGATAGANVDATTRSRQAWAASRVRTGVDPSGNLTPGPPRASYNTPSGSGRGAVRTPIVSPYRPSVTLARERTPLRQTTIDETLHNHRSVHGSPPPDLASDPAQHQRLKGGPIVSPRHSDRAMYARSLGASRFDVIRLATPEYHVNMDGCESLTEDILRDCGYTQIKACVEDVVVCYNDIIMVHHKIRELWYNSSAHTSGPQVDKILHKSISVFPKLTSLQVDDVVGFYDRLQEVSLGYSLALMPFDAVVLKNRFEGLCPPGLGLVRYAAMCKGFMELLPWLVPVTLSPQVSAVLASVRYESNNGYDYLWRVLELTVPGFDPTVPITVPSWADADDIFHFAQAYLLYFRLQAKLNFHYDDRTRSGIFLRAIQFSEFADTVTTLQSHVNSCRDEFDDGYLPPHLRLHGLATSIDQNVKARLRDIATPRARRLDGNFSRIQDVPTCNRVGRDETPRGGGFRDRGGDRHDRARGRPDSDQARGGDRTGRTPRGRGQIARPDRNRRPFLPDVQCAACKRVGHVAKHCDMLATAICLERYMKHDLSPGLRDSIEKEWLDRWKERLGNPTQTPRQILRAYVEELDITVAGLDDVMEWEFWETSDPDDDSQDE